MRTTERRRGCRACEARAARRARVRKRGAVASLVAAAFVVLVAGLWSSGVTGDRRLAAAGVGFSTLVLWFAGEMEAS